MEGRDERGGKERREERRELVQNNSKGNLGDFLKKQGKVFEEVQRQV